MSGTPAALIKVTIYDLPDGSTLLRLEDFQVTNGPDLRVILSPNANPESSSEVLEAGFIEMSKLKGNMGNQSYPLPAVNDMVTFKFDGSTASLSESCSPWPL